MTRRVQIFLWGILILSPCATNAQHSKGMLSIGFNHYVDSVLLKLDSSTYKNEFGQTYNISNFKYYISNIELISEKGKTIHSKEYFLINEDEPTSKKITLSSIPEGNYTSIRFMIGVDSLHNCKGAQSGALDPVNAMFWTWNTGYIFMKLEGKSSASTATGKTIEYHIGGYKEPSNCIKTITLKFDSPVIITSKQTSDIQIKVNAAEVLNTPTAIDFSKLPTVNDSKNATMIADNYMDMFSIEKQTTEASLRAK